MNTPFKAFTIRHSQRVNALITDVFIGEPFDPSRGQHSTKGGKYKGIWDTGAMSSVITQNVVDHGNLQPVGMTIVHTAGGIRDSPLYLVSIRLPNDVWFPQVTATLGEITDGIDVLIGMDVICVGDFAITHFGNKTTFTFRCPSVGHLDFVEQIEQVKEPAQPPAPYRNRPCPCGSGKKYKHCHGK